MEQERWKKVDKLANEALDLDTTERESFLDNAPNASPSLANDAKLILKAIQDAEGFLESPLQRDTDTAVTKQTPTLPKVIGNYRILEKLGEGGMGIVYLVEQLPPIRRKLALKVVRRGIDNKEAIARFASEHQALAYMDHPYVAHIYDSDLTDDGQPFFTMEYLPGLSITDYCRTHELSLKERLLLFVKVCEGVQHAHQRGIIHRDLKPSNIMVVEHDDVPTPKIIDFGIAKAVSGISLTNLTLYTERGVIMGTPSYMSPEQADIRAGDIDTRTDVYALGAVLYELLCGTPPYDPIRLRDASLSEILRIICKEEPKSPSNKSRTNPDAEPIFKAIPNHTLSRTLRGELDWITMKALEKERSRRYNSAVDLADDIRRYLKNEPVSASPPSRIYLTRKFIYRNRSTVFSAVVCVLALTAMLVNWFHGRQENQVLINEKNSVQQQMDSLQEVIEKIFSSHEHTMLEAVEHARSKLIKEKPAQKDFYFRSFGIMYLKMGLYEKASQTLKDAYNTSVLKWGTSHNIPLETLYYLAMSCYKNADYSSAIKNLNRLVHKQQLLSYSQADTWPARTLLASTLRRTNHPEEADALFQAIITEQEGKPEAEIQLAVTLSHHAQTMNGKEDRGKAEEIFQRSRQLLSMLPEDDDRRMDANTSYARFLYKAGAFDRAESLSKQLYHLRTEKYGENHPKTLWAGHDLAKIYSVSGKNGVAVLLAEKITNARTAVLGAHHRHTLSGKDLFADCLANARNYERAFQIMEEVYHVRVALLGSDHLSNLLTASNMGELLSKLNRHEEALALLQQTAEISEGRYSARHERTLTTRLTLARAQWAAARNGEAVSLLSQIAPVLREKYPAGHWFIQDLQDLEAKTR